jgi:hypothetical protein
MNPQFTGMRKLAAQVIIQAINDYFAAKEKLKHPPAEYLSLVRQAEYKTYWRLEKKYAYRFLVNDSTWHEIIGLKPEYIKRKLDDPNFKFTLALNNVARSSRKNQYV